MDIVREVWILRSMRAVVEWVAASPWRYFTLIFLLSMAIRVSQLNRLDRWELVPDDRREIGAIAISLAETGEFANPYFIPTGPTAHLPPIPPLIDSLIFRVFGLTSTAGFVRGLSIFATASLLFALLPWFSERFGTGASPGVIAGLLCALGGLSGSISDNLPGHGEYLTGLILGFLLVAFLQRWKQQNIGWRSSLLLGLATGVSFHVQPALLLVLVGCMLFELCWLKSPRKWSLAGLLALGVLLACLPWAWRNYKTFNAPIFIRSNFGLELRMGNNEDAAATFEEMSVIGTHYLHPRAQIQEARKLLAVGEAEYMHQAGRQAVAWIKTHPHEFFSLTIRRFASLWAGPLSRSVMDSPVLLLTVVAIAGACLSFPRITIPQRAAFLIPLITYPLVYYIVAYMPRYRIPIDWLLYILAGVSIWMIIGGSIRTSRI